MSPSPRTITKPQAGGCPCPAPGRGLTCSEKTAREKWRTERGRTAATRVLSSERSHSAGLSFPPFHRLLATSSLFLSVSTHNQENPNKYNTRDAPSFKNTNPKPPLTPYHPLATVSAEADSNRNFSVLLFLGRFVNWLICPFPPLLFFFPPQNSLTLSLCTIVILSSNKPGIQPLLKNHSSTQAKHRPLRPVLLSQLPIGPHA